jgi:tetratricopeptide (TPR) repeat protein
MTSSQSALIKPTVALSALLMSAVTLFLSGCQTDIIHQRPMAELNQKAQVLMATGDYAGAIARLESAHDLNPNEPKTTYNLALAYQAADKPMLAIPLVADLLDKPPAEAPSIGELKKTLGVLWEARGDELFKAAQDMADDKGKPGQKATVRAFANEREIEAERAYRTAIDYYRQALESKDLKDYDSIQQQMAALEARKAKMPPVRL